MTQQMPTPRPPSAAQNGGEITDQVRVIEAVSGGTPVAGVRVYFRTQKGQQGSVFVPESAYSAAGAIAAARKMANELDAAHGKTI